MGTEARYQRTLPNCNETLPPQIYSQVLLLASTQPSAYNSSISCPESSRTRQRTQGGNILHCGRLVFIVKFIYSEIAWFFKNNLETDTKSYVLCKELMALPDLTWKRPVFRRKEEYPLLQSKSHVPAVGVTLLPKLWPLLEGLLCFCRKTAPKPPCHCAE